MTEYLERWFECGTCRERLEGVAWHCRICASHVPVTMRVCPGCETGVSPMVEAAARRHQREERRQRHPGVAA